MNNKEIEEKVKGKMQDIAKMVKSQLPDSFGFILLTFEHNTNKGDMIYVSDSNREDVIKAMKEFIEKTENTYGNDTGKY